MTCLHPANPTQLFRVFETTLASVGCLLWLGIEPVFGQGTMDPPGVTVLRTGGGLPLVTSFQQIQVASLPIPQELYFEFGFGTDEAPSPGQILDSFSVTVQDVTMMNTLVLLTADGSAVVWAPTTPGGVVIPPDAILRHSIAFPSLQPVLAQQSAFAVTVPLPTVFTGPVNVHFDLFDNLDPTPSLGWYRAVIIPEPHTWALLVAGVVLLWMRKRSPH